MQPPLLFIYSFSNGHLELSNDFFLINFVYCINFLYVRSPFSSFSCFSNAQPLLLTLFFGLLNRLLLLCDVMIKIQFWIYCKTWPSSRRCVRDCWVKQENRIDCGRNEERNQPISTRHNERDSQLCKTPALSFLRFSVAELGCWTLHSEKAFNRYSKRFERLFLPITIDVSIFALKKANAITTTGMVFLNELSFPK